MAELDAVALGNGLYEFTRETDPGVFESANFTVFHHGLPFIAAATNAQPCTEEHEVYKNAYCKLEAPAVELSCIAGPGGSRITIKQRPIKKCKSPGTAYCVEVKQVNKIKETYDDSECTVLTNVEVIDRKFRCK